MWVHILFVLCFGVFFSAARSNELFPFGKYYVVYMGKDSGWPMSTAEGKCKEFGKKLLDVQTKEKWNEIERLLRTLEYAQWTYPRELFYVAGKRVQNKFFWSDGTELPTNAGYWGPGQPNFYENQNCITIEWFDGEKVGLNDWVCGQALGYICEDIPEKPTELPYVTHE